MSTPRKTVQCRDAKEVLMAYRNWNVTHYALFNGNQLLFAYDEQDGDMNAGEQMLQQWLNTIHNSQSAAIYTLCIYKRLKGDIDNSTKYNGSINFQLTEYQWGNNPTNSLQVMSPEYKLMTDQVNALTLQVKQLKESLDDDQEEEDDFDKAIGKVERILENPLVLGLVQQFMPAGKTLSAPVKHVEPQLGKVERIAGVSMTDEKENQLAEALTILKNNVKNLSAVMQQLALLSEKQPGKFNFYMSILMKMKL